MNLFFLHILDPSSETSVMLRSANSDRFLIERLIHKHRDFLIRKYHEHQDRQR